MALRDIPYGEVWPSEEIARRKAMIVGAPCNMHWAVVERLPVHEDIRRGQGKLGGLFANHRQSLDNLTTEAAHTVCCTSTPVSGLSGCQCVYRLSLDRSDAGSRGTVQSDISQLV